MRFQFEDQLLDIGRRELTRAGDPVALEPQVFDLLVYVIRNRERVVSKDDLIEAVWGGRIVSDSTLTTRINAMRKALGDSGEEQRLIRTVARKGIRFVGTVTEGGTSAPDLAPADASMPDRPSLPLPDKPSIAVLPFQNMSGDPDQEYFADGMVEEIITALSRFKEIFVIARNSSFTYKGRAVDVKQVAHELGVRYVLEGSVRKSGQKLRIAGQLVDAATGIHIWAHRFDGDLADVFDLQDSVAASVIGAVAPKIEAAEIERARRKQTEDLGAYDLCLRARPLVYAMTSEGTREALGLLERAVEQDPNYALAKARAAGCYSWLANNGWTKDEASETARAVQLARAAIAQDMDDAEVLAPAAMALVRFTGDLTEAHLLMARALSLNSNFAEAWAFSAFLHIFSGTTDVAVEHFERALRISPLGPLRYLFLGGLGIAHFVDQRLETAVGHLTQATKEHRYYLSNFRFLASALAHLGRLEEARRIVQYTLAVSPAATLRGIARRLRYQPEHAAFYLDGLRKAGLPE